ncbi:MAG: cation diffusion facilitator family transporter [Candidatus Shapirobacteria bacterium]|nr:cation diffusion facilitator family transporter [Candidatus Shapirobacteria bacterium]
MKERIALVSILVNLILAGGKVAVGVASGSASVLAGGIDSSVDIFSSLVSYLGIRVSAKPADESHPYGHYKFEALSATIITLIILATGVGVIYSAYQGFLKPEKINVNYLVFGVMIFSVVINETMSRIKTFYGKKEDSVSLLSDGVHSRIDVYTSLVILIGLFFTRYWPWADSILAALMGCYIIKESFRVGREAIGSLLDVSAGEETEAKIKAIAKKKKVKVASLKTQKKGSIVTANLAISLSSILSVKEATDISTSFRKELMGKIKNLRFVAIEIISHETTTGFYRPALGRGFGWQKRGRFKEKIEEAKGQGPGGGCICPTCNYQVSHQRGIPCSSLQCPKCKTNLERN